MPNGSYSLEEAAAKRSMLRLACPACGRRGRYRIDRLMERYRWEGLRITFAALARGDQWL